MQLHLSKKWYYFPKTGGSNQGSIVTRCWRNLDGVKFLRILEVGVEFFFSNRTVQFSHF